MAALTGLNKKETVAKYGDEQVKLWRRSYSTPPPEIELDSPHASSRGGTRRPEGGHAEGRDRGPPPLGHAWVRARVAAQAPHNQNEYLHIPEESLPLSECLKDCVERTVRMRTHMHTVDRCT